MRRLAVLLALLLTLAAPAAARADAFLPPAGHIWTGFSGGYDAQPFTGQTGLRPKVMGIFVTFGSLGEYVFDDPAAMGARLMLHVSTTNGYGAPERITPLAIARGHGDAYLIKLNRRIAAAGEPVYVRFLAEMNQANNAYAAFDRSGRSRGPAHSPEAFKQAWRRATLILRGGAVDAIDARLARLGLPAVRGAAGELPRAPVAMAWVPQTRGTPDIPANMPRAYWPGGAYVDWVGTDFYSRFPNFTALEAFYRAFPRKPFLFGEWALWGSDDPAFVSRLFAWTAGHPRVRLSLYNQGGLQDGPFRLRRYPRSAARLKAVLRAPKYR